jgi:hypothetical protein
MKTDSGNFISSPMRRVKAKGLVVVYKSREMSNFRVKPEVA